jgi:hypothetical protein
MGLRQLVDRYCTVTDILVWLKRANSPQGRPVYHQTPLELKCRWDNVRKVAITKEGRTITTNAVLMSPDEIPESSLVFRGTLANWQAMSTYPALPTPLQGGYEVVGTGETPDFNGDDLLFVAYL